MATGGNFLMKQKKCCSNCLKGTGMAVNNDILCRDKGVVSPDYVCSKHKFLPETKSFKDQDIKCIDCSNFIINVEAQSPNTGLCQLFSVRQFDGCSKKACSKYDKKVRLEVC